MITRKIQEQVWLLLNEIMSEKPRQDLAESRTSRIHYFAYIDPSIVDCATTIVLWAIKSQFDRIFEARNPLHETCESREHDEIYDKHHTTYTRHHFCEGINRINRNCKEVFYTFIICLLSRYNSKLNNFFFVYLRSVNSEFSLSLYFLVKILEYRSVHIFSSSHTVE